MNQVTFTPEQAAFLDEMAVLDDARDEREALVADWVARASAAEADAVASRVAGILRMMNPN